MKKILFAFSLLLSSNLVQASNLSGPRLGMTFLDEGTIAYLVSRDIKVGSSISQYGWQFETKLYKSDTGPEVVTEFIPLFGGFEEGLILPSLTWLTGVRLPFGSEFAAGPNVSATAVGFAMSVGHNTKIGDLNLPLNIAYVSSKHGGRISLMIGFNVRTGKN